MLCPRDCFQVMVRCVQHEHEVGTGPLTTTWDDVAAVLAPVHPRDSIAFLETRVACAIPPLRGAAALASAHAQLQCLLELRSLLEARLARASSGGGGGGAELRGDAESSTHAEHPRHRLAALLADVLEACARHLAPPDAAAALQAAAALRLELQGGRHPATMDALRALASALDGAGRRPQAEMVLRREVEARVALGGSAHPDTAAARHKLGSLLFKQRKVAEARGLLQGALAAAALNPTVLPHVLAALHALLGIVSDELGHRAEV